MTTPTPDQITEAGLYPGLDEVAYHRHPALSSSGSKALIQSPALYQHQRKHPVEKPIFNFGKAAHARVLGVGADLEIVHKLTIKKESVPADSYDTQSAQRDAERIIAEGKTPILEKEIALLDGIVSAVRHHPLASALFADADGTPEVSAFWDHDGVPLRARFDFLRKPSGAGRVLLPDLKTAVSAHPREFAKSMAKYQYPMQAAFYEDALLRLGYAREVEFLLVAVEKTEPFLVSVVGLTRDDMERGRLLMRHAVDLYRRCTESGQWPGYPNEVHYPELPVWWRYEVEETVA